MARNLLFLPAQRWDLLVRTSGNEGKINGGPSGAVSGVGAGRSSSSVHGKLLEGNFGRE